MQYLNLSNHAYYPEPVVMALHGMGASFQETIDKLRSDIKDRIGSFARDKFDEYLGGIKEEVEKGAAGPWFEKLKKYLPEDWVNYVWNELRKSFLDGLSQNPDVQVKVGIGVAAVVGVLALAFLAGNSRGRRVSRRRRRT